MKEKRKVLQHPVKIGIIGGGQLGKMTALIAKSMGYSVIILDPTADCPASSLADLHIIASFNDKQQIRKLAQSSDVLTYEFEHINADILIELENEGYNIYPSGKTLKNIQDKYIQKSMLSSAGINVPKFLALNNDKDLNNCVKALGFPVIVKTRAGGYDGKGNFVIENYQELQEIFSKFKNQNLMAEKFIDFDLELSVIIARDLKNKIVVYPVAQNTHKNSILHKTLVPSNVEKLIIKNIKAVGKRVMKVLDDYGVFCIEMFLDKNGEVYVNEIAPRPHNSGHYTIEACATSQYEQLVRIITQMPLGSAKLRSPCVMVNILGNDIVEGEHKFEGIENLLSLPDTHLHIYGKRFTKSLKKLGHITVLHKSIKTAEEIAETALKTINIIPLREKLCSK